MVQSGSGALADSRQAGRELASALARGVQPQPVPVRLTLQAGEFCVGTTAGVILQWLDSEGEYTKKSGGYLFGGGGVGLAYNAVRLSSNLMGNSIRKARASRQAASSGALWKAGMSLSRIAGSPYRVHASGSISGIRKSAWLTVMDGPSNWRSAVSPEPLCKYRHPTTGS